MSKESSLKGALLEDEARQRLPPSLPACTSSLFSLRHSPTTGYGVFATTSIPAQTQLIVCEAPAVYVLYREFRKEVCAWCFRYERGRNWKVRFSVNNNANEDADSRASGPRYGASGGMAFCSEECKEMWQKEYGDKALEAYVAVEAFVQKQSRNKAWTVSEDDCDDNLDIPNEEDIEEEWKAAEEKAKLMRVLRRGGSLNGTSSSNSSSKDSNDKTKPPSKRAKQALAEVLALPILASDVFLFLLNGVLCASSRNWRSVLTLIPAPSKIYRNKLALRQLTRSYLHLTALLPTSLLPYVTRPTFEAVLGRDIANSFGIWSAEPDAKPSSTDQCMDAGAEMLGYGIWTSVSFFNHACVPNVARHRVARSWVFTAARDIAEGEELCISYIRGEENILRLKERRNRLKKSWGFTCQCQKCSSEEQAEQDEE